MKKIIKEAENLIDLGRISEADALLRDNLRQFDTGVQNSDISRMYELRGVCAFLQTDMEKAMKSYYFSAIRDTVLLNQLEHYSSYLFCLQYNSKVSDMDYYNAFQIYNNLLRNIKKYNDYKSKGEKIRIGYISADFRDHAMSSFINPLLSKFNSEQFVVHVYCLNKEDDITKRLRNNNVIWNNMYNISPGEIAEQVYEDGIDILFDLCGHTHGGESLIVLAHRPARVQISGLGWLYNTGLEAVDFLLTDDFASAVENGFEEKLSLPICQLCYSPVVANTVPIREKGHIFPFASFNNYDKITNDVLTLWLKILNDISGACLLLKDTTKIISRQEAMKERLRVLGYRDDQYVLECSEDDYIQRYNDVGVMLDTFPYTGGATTCDALSMGVPVVTLAGKRFGSRSSASVLYYAGFAEWIAYDEEEYVEKAQNTYKGLKNTNISKQRIRDRFLSSDVTNGGKYMEKLESIYRDLVERK